MTDVKDAQWTADNVVRGVQLAEGAEARRWTFLQFSPVFFFDRLAGHRRPSAHHLSPYADAQKGNQVDNLLRLQLASLSLSSRCGGTLSAKLCLKSGGQLGKGGLEDGRLKVPVIEVREDPASDADDVDEETVQNGKLYRQCHRGKVRQLVEDLKAKMVGRHYGELTLLLLLLLLLGTRNR